MDSVLQRIGDVTIERVISKKQSSSGEGKDAQNQNVEDSETDFSMSGEELSDEEVTDIEELHSSKSAAPDDADIKEDLDAKLDSAELHDIPFVDCKQSISSISSDVTIKRKGEEANLDISSKKLKPNESQSVCETVCPDAKDSSGSIDQNKDIIEADLIDEISPDRKRTDIIDSVDELSDDEYEETDSDDELEAKKIKAEHISPGGVTTEPIDIEKTDFIEKLAQGIPFGDDTIVKTEIIDKDCSSMSKESTDTSEYDYDITEKLREMGEISVQPVKKGEIPARKMNLDEPESEVSVTAAKKPGSDTDDEEQTGAERKIGNLRRNIREVMDETKLDEATLAAQRQEMERLRRVQEQQRIIREVQRQIAFNRQNSKNQQRVVSLLQGNSSSSGIRPSGSGVAGGQCANSRMGNNTVLVKLPNGETKSMTRVPKGQSVFEMIRTHKNINLQNRCGVPNRNLISGKGGHITPSVSIAPVAKKQPSTVPTSDAGLAKSKKDVETIDVSSSDDDCIVLSEDDEEPEPEEDPSNSGMHTNDAYNVPDEQGRVLINVGHPENEPDIFLAPQIARVIKPHQIGGVRFLYDNVIESIERFNTSTGFGCILAHSMGLGKTLQVVCFSDIFLRHTTAKTILCIMPINTLQNWVAEFNMWLPVDSTNSPLTAHGEVRPRNFNLHVLNDSHKSLTARARIIQEWNKDGGVLLIGYELYRLLSLKRNSRAKRKKKPAEVVDLEEDDKNKVLFDEIHAALVKPGPDLVICDEGHRIKNSHASISQALKQIRSKRRVVLTGYPLQNNLLEYWCMVDFVRPNYLGTKTEFSNMFERPIQNGQCVDSTPQDVRLMRFRAHVLHSLLEGFVQRRSHAVLQVTLPQKEEYVMLVRMTAFQRKLYDTFMNDVVRTKTVPNPLKAFAVCCKIWNHPDVLYYFLKKREESDAVADIDLEEVAGAVSTTGPTTVATNSTPSATKRSRAKGGKTATPRKDNRKSKQNTATTTSPASTTACTSTSTTTTSTVTSTAMNTTNTTNTESSSVSTSVVTSSDSSSSSSSSIPPPTTTSSVSPSFSSSSNQPYTSTAQPPPTPAPPPIMSPYPSNQNYNYSAPSTPAPAPTPTPTPTPAPPPPASNSDYYNQNTNYPNNPQYNNPQFYPNNNPPNQYGTNTNYYNQNYPNYNQDNWSSNWNNTNDNQQQQFGENVSNQFPPSANNTNMTSQYPPATANNNQYPPSENSNSSTYPSTSNTPNAPQYPPPPPNVNTPQYQTGNNQQYSTDSSNSAQFPPRNTNTPQYQSGGPNTPQYSPSGNNTSPYPTGNTNPSPYPPANTNTVPYPPVNVNTSQFGPTNTAATSYAPGNSTTSFSSSNSTTTSFTPGNTVTSFASGNTTQSFAPGNTATSYATGNVTTSYASGNTTPSYTPGNTSTSYAPGNTTTTFAPGNVTPSFTPGNTATSFTSGNTTTTTYTPGNNSVSPYPISNTSTTLYSSTQDMNTSSSRYPQDNNVNSQYPQDHPANNNAQQYPMNNINTNQCAPGGIPPYNNTGNNNMPSGGYGHQQYPPRNTNDTQRYPQTTLYDTNTDIKPNVMNFTSNENVPSYSSAPISTNNPMPTSSINSTITSYNMDQKPDQIPSNNYYNPQANNNKATDSNAGQPVHSLPPPMPPQNGQFYPQPMNATNTYPNVEIKTEPNTIPPNNQYYPNSNPTPMYPPYPNVPPNQPPPPNSTFDNTEIKTEPGTQPPYYGNPPPSAPGGPPVPPTGYNYYPPPYSQQPMYNPTSTTNSNMYPPPPNPNYNNNQFGGNSTAPWQQQQNDPSVQIKDEKCIKTENVEIKTETKPDIKMEIKQEDGEQKPLCQSDTEIKNENEKSETTEAETEDGLMKDDEIKMDILPTAKLKEDAGINYDWAVELLKGYVPGCIENSAKMEILFCIIRESMALGDRILLFSQSLFTLNLIEEFLQRYQVPGHDEKWARNVNYYRLDGSTSALEREKLINEFNANNNIHLFMVSTRAGSLGINLVGANRVVVFDASWNPCHDTQAVCRVYRYGQKKPCFVYRLVMDNCLEKKIYDRQINKQGMSDRVVDECNPDAHLSMKDVTNLCWDDEKETEIKDFSHCKEKYIDIVMQKVLDNHSHVLSREPFQHESLLVDRKEKKLSQAEKRMAKRSYEMEKQAVNNAARSATYSYHGGMGTGMIHRGMRMTNDGSMHNKPIASVRPMQAELNSQLVRDGQRRTRWIPAEVWQRQGMTAQEMTLPLDVVIPTNGGERGNIVLKAGQKVLVLKSPKGIYMQLECGKIVAIRTAMKMRGNTSNVSQGGKISPGAGTPKSSDEGSSDGSLLKKVNPRTNIGKSIPLPLKNNSAVTITPKNPGQQKLVKPFTQVNAMGKMPPKTCVPRQVNARIQNIRYPNKVNSPNMQQQKAGVQLGKAKPFNISTNQKADDSSSEKLNPTDGKDTLQTDEPETHVIPSSDEDQPQNGDKDENFSENELDIHEQDTQMHMPQKPQDMNPVKDVEMPMMEQLSQPQPNLQHNVVKPYDNKMEISSKSMSSLNTHTNVPTPTPAPVPTPVPVCANNMNNEISPPIELKTENETCIEINKPIKPKRDVKTPGLQILEVKSLDKSEMINVDTNTFQEPAMNTDMVIKTGPSIGSKTPTVLDVSKLPSSNTPKSSLKNYRHNFSSQKALKTSNPSALSRLEQTTSSIGSNSGDKPSLQSSLDKITADSPTGPQIISMDTSSSMASPDISIKKTQSVLPLKDGMVVEQQQQQQQQQLQQQQQPPPKPKPARRNTKKNQNIAPVITHPPISEPQTIDLDSSDNESPTKMDTENKQSSSTDMQQNYPPTNMDTNMYNYNNYAPMNTPYYGNYNPPQGPYPGPPPMQQPYPQNHDLNNYSNVEPKTMAADKPIKQENPDMSSHQPPSTEVIPSNTDYRRDQPMPMDQKPIPNQPPNPPYPPQQHMMAPPPINNNMVNYGQPAQYPPPNYSAMPPYPSNNQYQPPYQPPPPPGPHYNQNYPPYGSAFHRPEMMPQYPPPPQSHPPVAENYAPPPHAAGPPGPPTQQPGPSMPPAGPPYAAPSIRPGYPPQGPPGYPPYPPHQAPPPPMFTGYNDYNQYNNPGGGYNQYINPPYPSNNPPANPPPS